MRYLSGEEPQIGDTVEIEGRHRSTVTVCVEQSAASSEAEAALFRFLGSGIMVETDFLGLVHYTDQDTVDDARIRLLWRHGAGQVQNLDSTEQAD